MTTNFTRRAGWAAALALFLCGTAAAQENLDSGKTPAELYAANCAICHKSPQGLSRAGGPLNGLQAFLRVHYTASREAAAAIAGYLESIDKGAPTPARARKRLAKPDEKAKPGEAKPAAASKVGEPKPTETKSSEPKSSEPKSSETKSSETTPSAPDQAKPSAAAAGKQDQPVEAKAEPAPPKTPPKTPRAVAKPDPEKTSD